MENEIEPMLQFFEYAHLPDDLAEVSSQFAVVAGFIVAELPRNPERTVALRKLLEAKDCAVRARLYR
jgi:ferritin-like protein